MALYRLGDETYKQLEYPEVVWGTKLGISYLLPDLWPKLDRVSSKSENRLYCWFYGKAATQGKGSVRVLYPYESEPRSQILTIRNVNLAEIPYILLEACEGRFVGWLSERDEILSRSRFLKISQYNFLDVTTFYAKFL